MSKITKALRRDKKRYKKINGMKRDGDSVKNIQRIQQKRRTKIINKNRQAKEKLWELEYE